MTGPALVLALALAKKPRREIFKVEIPVVRHICRTSKVVPALRYEVETKLARRGSGGRRAGPAVSDGHPVLEVTTSRHVLNFHWQVLLKTDGTELANMWQLTWSF